MKQRKVSFHFKGKKISLDVKECLGIELGRGLMFRRREKAPIILFDLGKNSKMALTSLFVFFPFLVIWLDEECRVLEVRKIKPFVPIVNIKGRYSRIIEIPINKKNEKILKILDETKGLKT